MRKPRAKILPIAAAVLFIGTLLLAALSAPAQDKPPSRSAFKDAEDGAFDISDWLVQKKGFLLLPIIITEPAVGYGGGAVAVFFHSSYSEKNGPPSMTGVAGAGTENGTWMAGLFHEGFWKHDTIRYRGALARTKANIAYYGSGNVALPGDGSVNLNLDAWVLLQQLKFRIARSNFFIGARYLYLDTDNTFKWPIETPEYTGTQFHSTLSEATLILNLDSRDNIFSPTRGFYVDLTGTYSDTWFGGDGLYGRIGASALGYFSAGPRLVGGIRYEGHYSLGPVPFWARPFIALRGVPAMKYQNKNTTLLEAEVDWNLYKRWTLLGFTGLGNAFESFADFDKGKTARTLGFGFRYLVARKLGANMGLDLAWSNDDFAFYIVFGSSWLR